MKNQHIEHFLEDSSYRDSKLQEVFNKISNIWQQQNPVSIKQKLSSEVIESVLPERNPIPAEGKKRCSPSGVRLSRSAGPFGYGGAGEKAAKEQRKSHLRNGFSSPSAESRVTDPRMRKPRFRTPRRTKTVGACALLSLPRNSC